LKKIIRQSSGCPGSRTCIQEEIQMKKSLVLLIAVTVTAIAGCAPFAPQASQEADEAFPAATPPEVRNIILMIADGVGAGAWTAAEFANNDLAVKRMPVVGLIDTRSAVHK